jgi:very-short-patch-repair endonuclease
MAYQNGHGSVWDLAGEQDDVVTRPQLMALGLSPEAIKHRVRKGRLHPLWPGVYAVGSPHVSRRGVWRAAVLACGEGAALSHTDAAELLQIGPPAFHEIEVSVPATSHPRGRGIKVHRRKTFEVTARHGIPVTTPACTIIDLAPRLSRDPLEEMIGKADLRGLITPPRLRAAAAACKNRRGAARVVATLDRRTFRLTRSKLERLFILIAVRAGLPVPLTRQWVNGFEVDFYWPDLGVVVETDGLTYHRTAAQQAEDVVRNLAHAASGLLPLRFTHEQIAYQPSYVEAILRRVTSRIGVRSGGS